MDHLRKTKSQLIADLDRAHARIAELEQRVTQTGSSDYQQAAGLLRATEENYRSLVENSENAIAVLDHEGKILYANPYGIQVWNDPQVIGKTIFDVYPSAYAARYIKVIQQVIETGISVVDEVESMINGQSMWFRLSMTPLKNPDDTVTTLLLNAWDLTARRQSERALQISEARARGMLEAIPDLMFRLDKDGIFLDYKADVHDLYVQSEPTIIGRRNRDICPPEFADLIDQKIRQTLDTNQLQSFEYQLLLPGRGIRSYEARMSPSGHDEVTAVVRDITESKRAEILVYAQRDLARSIGAVTSDQEALDICLNTALHVSGLDSGGIYLFNTDSTRLELVHHRGLGDEFIRSVLQYPADSENATQVRQGITIQYSYAEINKFQSYMAEGLHAIIMVPIYYQQQVIGCLNIASHTLHEIPTDARQALETIAAEIGNFVVYLRSESALRTSEQNFRLITETIQEVFWMFDNQQNKIIYISPAYETIWGNSVQSLYDDNSLYITDIHPDDRPILLDALERQAKAEKTEFEYRVVRPDGSIRYIYDRSFPIVDRDGVLTRTAGIAQDITARNQMEAEKQALIETLNERAQDLTLLLNAGRELSETLDLQQIYTIIYRYLTAAVPCTILIISSFDPQTELITCEYLHTEEGAQDVSEFPSIPLEPPGKGTQSLVLRSGKSLLLPDYVAALRTARTTYHFDENGQIVDEPEDDKDLARSAIIVPLKVNGITVGAMQILSHSLHDHTEDHLRFVEAFAFRVSASLSNARLFAELEKRVQERTAEIEGTRQRLELATRAAELGIWDWNINTHELICDRQMEVIYGENANQFQNSIEKFLDIVHAEDKANLSIFMKNKMERGFNGGPIQYRITTPNGVIKHIETHAIVVHDKAGHPKHLIGVSKDVTQQQLAEDALRQREETYRALFDNSNDGIFLMSSEGHEQMANRKALEMLEYTFEEYIQLSNNNLIVSEEYAHASEKFRAVLRGETVPPYERTMLSKSGKKIEVEVNLSAIRDPKGNIFLVQSVVRDITQRKLAERAIRESEERYRTAISAANAVPYSLDYESENYTFIGEGIEIITGYTREELTHSVFASFILETRLRGELAGLTTAEAGQRIRSGQIPGDVVWHSDLFIKNKTGENRWLSDIAVQILNEQGKPVGAIGILQDITERKMAEEALRQTNLELEQALRVKDEFLASMSHELRTPLTGILGLSEAMQYNTYGEINEKQRKVLGNIENSGRHLLELINDILDISKMEAGKLELHIQPCQLSEVCQSSIQITKGMAQKKEQNVTFSMDPASIMILGDLRRLKQIVVNLLSNAIKYSPPKTQIDLTVIADAQAQTVKITVTDHGIGITQDDLKILFQPFVQLDSSLSRQQSGTGLGLALVKRLVELHGGALDVESTPGQGSRFTVTLICPPADAIIQNNRSYMPLQVQQAVVIEADTVDSERLSRYLKILGINPTILLSGIGAVEKVIEVQPGMILLDIDLPGISGWEVLEQLHSNESTQHIPVIITSLEEDRDRASQLGADIYLVKPFSLPELNTALLRAQQTFTPAVNVHTTSDPSSLATVMIVDDNEINTFMIEDFLVSRHFSVSSVTNGLDFLAQASTVRPDIVLMDIQMPEIDGLETIRRLRIHPDPQLASVPVIAMTALAMPGDRERCLAAGATEYVSKPIRLQDLGSTIQKMIAQKKSN